VGAANLIAAWGSPKIAAIHSCGPSASGAFVITAAIADLEKMNSSAND
jgi:hypothetical protein